MTRTFRSTHKFDKQLKNMDKKIFSQAIKAIDLFMKDPFHPSLRFKKVQGTSNFFELSVNMSVRIIIEITMSETEERNTLYIIGTHEQVFPIN